MKRILVTGGTGLIGTSLLKQLVTHHTVYALSRQKGDLAGVKYIHMDLCEPINMTQLPDAVDVIIHLAQSDHHHQFPENMIDLFNINTQSTVYLLQYAKRVGVKQFIYASTGGLYGTSEKLVHEQDPVVINEESPLHFYFKSKYSSELFLNSFSAFMTITKLRFFFVYGAKQKEHMLFPRLIRAIREEKEITLHGDDGVKINPIYVEDAAQCICNCMDQEVAGVMNVAGNEILTMRQIGKILGEVLQKQVYFKNIEHQQPQHLFADHMRMKSVYTPLFSFKEGITHMIGQMKST